MITFQRFRNATFIAAIHTLAPLFLLDPVTPNCGDKIRPDKKRVGKLAEECTYKEWGLANIKGN
jgi:hypothetical protein